MRTGARRAARAAGWGAVLALALSPLALESGQQAAEGSLAARLLGPIGSLAASAQWIRFEAALDAGRPALAYERAALALRLDPGATGGWSYLAAHLALGRGSAEAEPDPARRGAWFRAALDVLERGEATARRPEVLAEQRGLYLAAVAESGGAIRWPGGAAAAHREAAAAFERSAALGSLRGPELAERARAAARVLEEDR